MDYDNDDIKEFMKKMCFIYEPALNNSIRQSFINRRKLFGPFEQSTTPIDKGISRKINRTEIGFYIDEINIKAKNFQPITTVSIIYVIFYFVILIYAVLQYQRDKGSIRARHIFIFSVSLIIS